MYDHFTQSATLTTRSDAEGPFGILDATVRRQH